MDETDRKKLLFDWLKIENDLVNKQIGAWSEADQKIIAVMATIVVAIIGLTSSRYIESSGNTPAYMILLASILMSLAVIQSSLYSSLILLALERKVDLSKKWQASSRKTRILHLLRMLQQKPDLMNPT